MHIAPRCGVLAAIVAAVAALPALSEPLLPTFAEARAVCVHVAARGPAIAAELVRSGLLDANNDGKVDQVAVGVGEGTIGGDVLQFRPKGAPKNSEPVETTPEGFQSGAYVALGARWLPFRGKVYTLNFASENLRHAIYLGYIAANNTEHLICEFANIEQATLKPVDAASGQLCRDVVAKKVDYIGVRDTEEPPARRRDTATMGRVEVDFRNRGKPEPLALLAYESGAGRGCTYRYFEAIAGSDVAEAGDSHAVLMAVQSIRLDQPVRIGPSCRDNDPRWFGYRGKVYFDNASRPTSYGEPFFREIKLVDDRQVATLCRGEFKVRWKVQTMGDGFK